MAKTIRQLPRPPVLIGHSMGGFIVQKYLENAILGFLDMFMFNLPKPRRVKTPVLVLGGARDNMFSPGEVEATARAYNTQPEIFADMSHDMMLEPGWQTVAERILTWLKELEL